MQTDVVLPRRQHASDTSVPVFPGKYLSVTTFKRDGTPVATPGALRRKRSSEETSVVVAFTPVH